MKDGKINCSEIVEEMFTVVKNILNVELHEPIDDLSDCIKNHTIDQNCGEDYFNATSLCINSFSLPFKSESVLYSRSAGPVDSFCRLICCDPYPFGNVFSCYMCQLVWYGTCETDEASLLAAPLNSKSVSNSEEMEENNSEDVSYDELAEISTVETEEEEDEEEEYEEDEEVDEEEEEDVKENEEYDEDDEDYEEGEEEEEDYDEESEN